MWISQKKWRELEERIADLEESVQGQILQPEYRRLYMPGRCFFDKGGVQMRKEISYLPDPFFEYGDPGKPGRVRLYVYCEDVKYVDAVARVAGVDIPEGVLGAMKRVLEFDYINRYVQSRYLLEHLRNSKQKVKLIYPRCGSDYEALKSGQWKDVFQF